LVDRKINAILINDRIIVWDIENAKKLYKNGFYGKYVGIRKARELEIDRPLELSLIEACYLVERGILRVIDVNGNEITFDKLIELANKYYENFNDVYVVYKDLKKRGYIVKSGLKFGTVFAVYEHGPGIDHAPFLVHILPFKERLDPLEIIRAGRLSHSVRKKFVIATIEPGSRKIRYFIFKWFG